jgi:hypothetical protein
MFFCLPSRLENFAEYSYNILDAIAKTCGIMQISYKYLDAEFCRIWWSFTRPQKGGAPQSALLALPKILDMAKSIADD